MSTPDHRLRPLAKMDKGPAPRTCQWIAGDPKVDASKCGEPAVPGKPWCPPHDQKAYQR